MTTNAFAPLARLALLGLCIALSFASPAKAQSAAPLPPAPGAERAVNGGATMSHPSLPGGPGRSPLEPYLVTWLLPISGILTVAAGIWVDKRVRAAGMRRTAPVRQRR